MLPLAKQDIVLHLFTNGTNFKPYAKINSIEIPGNRSYSYSLDLLLYLANKGKRIEALNIFMHENTTLEQILVEIDLDIAD